MGRLAGQLGPKTPPYSLASPSNPAIYAPISHGSMAVTGRPVATGPQVFMTLARIAHTLPEEPTGELNHGATRFFHASAVRGWRSLWPPIAPLESEDVGLHFRCPQQHPHHRPRADRAVAAPRVAGGQRHRRQGRT